MQSSSVLYSEDRFWLATFKNLGIVQWHSLPLLGHLLDLHFIESRLMKPRYNAATRCGIERYLGFE